MGLLGHDVDPAALVTASKACAGTPARHMIEHCDVFCDADRVRGGQDDAKLADLDALGLHCNVEVKQDRVVGDLEAFDMEMVFGKADGFIADLVGDDALFGDLFEHLLVEIVAHAGHALLDLFAIANGRQIEQGSFHSWLYPLATSQCCGGLCRAGRASTRRA